MLISLLSLMYNLISFHIQYNILFLNHIRHKRSYKKNKTILLWPYVTYVV